jgi:DNA-binding NarL/FixJ family response regulator
MTSVLIADDEDLVRSGLSVLLSAQPDIDVVGEAADGRAAVAAARRLRPDVVLMDVQMPGLDGITATVQLLADPAPPRVLVLTTFGLDTYVYDALRAGASGFLLKTARPDQLAEGVRTVAAGDALFSPAITRRLVEAYTRRPPPSATDPRLTALTHREREVFALIGRGLSNAEIAGRLYLGETTVKTHVGRVLAKLGARDRVHAVVLAYETGVVLPGEDVRD